MTDDNNTNKQLLAKLENDVIDLDEIKLENGLVNFGDYEILKNRALMVKDVLEKTEVTDENIQESKKLVAGARKVTTALNQRRIDIKKQILMPYDVFERQIKDITEIIDGADETVRKQINEIEEQERELKKAEIETMWSTRIVDYKINSYCETPFDLWFNESLLNKTKTMKSIEKEMVDWLEKTESDITMILNQENGQDIVEYYVNGGCDVTTAMTQYGEHKKQKEVIKQAIEKDSDVEMVSTFIVKGDKDIALARMLLQQNKINFIEN